MIHVSAGFAALASVIFLGRRDDMKPGEPTVPNNLPLVAVGAGLLWFGWFGFNAGGAYAADGPGRLCLHQHDHRRFHRHDRLDALRLAL